jgi:radical SAM protein with 4Fe4S-binding SPASM domain
MFKQKTATCIQDEPQLSLRCNQQEFVGNWLHHKENIAHLLSEDYLGIKPVLAEVAPTLRCPYRCSVCSYKEWKQKVGIWKSNDLNSPEIEMGRNELERLVQTLVETGIKGVLWTGGGDPSTWKLLPEAVKMCSQRGITSAIYTNGAFFTKDIAKELLVPDNLLEFVRFSINGVSPKTHAQFHGYKPEEAWIYRVLENLNDLLQLARERASQVAIAVSCIFDHRNVDDLIPLAQTLVKLQKETKKQITKLLVRPVINKDDWRDPLVMAAIDRASEYIPEVESLLQSNDIALHRGFSLQLDSTGESWEQDQRRVYKRCRASGWFLTVGPDLSAYVCCDRNGDPRFRIGNLQHQTVDEVWKSEKRKQVIAWVNSQACNDRLCFPGCRPDRLNLISHLLQEDEITHDMLIEMQENFPADGRRIYNC